MAYLKTNIWIALLLLMAMTTLNACAFHTTYRGKLIDAETLEPIEGAVVVAVWMKTIAFLAGSSQYFKDAKETLTDKNGDWSITGPKGQDVPRGFDLLYAIGLHHITGSPEIIYYKPGYRENTRGGFSAYPYIDTKQNLEGIVLNRMAETWDEIGKDNEAFPRGSIRFIPVKNPEQKLRHLDFSFQYPDNLQIIQRRIEYSQADYMVIGLKKATTREERLEAQPSPPTFNIDDSPILYKMINDERRKFGFKPIGRQEK